MVAGCTSPASTNSLRMGGRKSTSGHPVCLVAASESCLRFHRCEHPATTRQHAAKVSPAPSAKNPNSPASSPHGGRPAQPPDHRAESASSASAARTRSSRVFQKRRESIHQQQPKRTSLSTGENGPSHHLCWWSVRHASRSNRRTLSPWKTHTQGRRHPRRVQCSALSGSLRCSAHASALAQRLGHVQPRRPPRFPRLACTALLCVRFPPASLDLHLDACRPFFRIRKNDERAVLGGTPPPTPHTLDLCKTARM